ncbi:MAG: hypothetical protein ACK53C_01345 [Pseudomonadota bacterium]
MADQEFAPSQTFTARVGGTIRAQTKMPSSYPGAVGDPNVTLPGYATVDLRAGLSWDRYVLQVRAENLRDKLAFTGASTSGTVTGATVIRPRTITLSPSAAF